jgi:hypothetical protein
MITINILGFRNSGEESQICLDLGEIMAMLPLA